MKHWLDQLVVKIVGDPNEFDLEHRNLNGACFITAQGAIFSILINLFGEFSVTYNVVVYFTLVSISVLYYFSRIKRKTKFISSLFLILSIFVITTLWFYSQGIEGSTTSVIYTLILISLITFRTRHSLLIIIIYNVCLLSLIGIQIYFPETITPYKNKSVQIFDLSAGLIICTLIFSYLIVSLKGNYEIERNKVQKQNIEIQDKNAELEEKQEEINAQKEQLVKINNELVYVDEQKSRFFANISHEFRTPLSLIISPLQSLRDQTNDEFLMDQYSQILKHSERLLLLINQLLDISKIEKGKMQLVLQECDINANIRAIASSFEPITRKKGIVLDVNELRTDIQGFIDKDKFEKICYNLISNAFKFTNDGGKVEIIINQSGNGENLEIIVKDTGIGIDSEKIPYIFDRFYQVDNSASRSFDGSGIGLALTKELVLLHKGTITVTSNPNIGSTFIVTLPINKTAYTAENVIFEQPSTSEAKKPHPIESIHYESIPKNKKFSKLTNNNKVILVVEDNDDMRNHLINGLLKNFMVEQASNGEKGIEKAVSLQPDLILSDVMMPEIDGLQMTLTLKNNPITSHIPIVLLSAKASVEDKLEGLQIHADDYITKPFTIKEVVARIETILANRDKLKAKFSRTLMVEPSEITTTSFDEQFIREVLEIIELNMTNQTFSVDDLCREMSMSRTNIHLKLKAITNQSTTEFIRSIRLKRAAQLIKQKAGNISEIADMTGFASVQYFSRSFKEHFRVSPSDY